MADQSQPVRGRIQLGWDPEWDQEHKLPMTLYRDLVYARVGDGPLLLDLYVPRAREGKVPLNQSELLLTAFQKVGVDARLHVVRGGGHGFRDREINELVRQFFDAKLKHAVVSRAPESATNQ